MIATIVFSIIGLVLYGIFSYFFVIADCPRIVKILFCILSLVPFIGAVVTLILLIIGCFYHCPIYKYPNNDDIFLVRDTKLNRWLFNDIDWRKFDKNKKFNDL